MEWILAGALVASLALNVHFIRRVLAVRAAVADMRRALAAEESP